VTHEHVETVMVNPMSGAWDFDVRRIFEVGGASVLNRVGGPAFAAANEQTKLVENVADADAVLSIMGEAQEKVILSLNTQGRVREYQLRYRVGFRVHDGKGGEFLPANLVVLTRDVTFNDSDVLSKETEEQLMYRDMQRDMVQQIMRYLAAAQRPKPAEQ